MIMENEELLKELGFEEGQTLEDVAVENPTLLLQKVKEYVGKAVADTKEPPKAPEAEKPVEKESEVEKGSVSRAEHDKLMKRLSELEKKYEAKNITTKAQEKPVAGDIETGARTEPADQAPVSMLDQFIAMNNSQYNESKVFKTNN